MYVTDVAHQECLILRGLVICGCKASFFGPATNGNSCACRVALTSLKPHKLYRSLIVHHCLALVPLAANCQLRMLKKLISS